MDSSASVKSIGIAGRLFVILQYLIPHHMLSWLMHQLTRVEWLPLKNLMIKRAIALYKVDMSEALESDPEKYSSFNAFFTRALQPDARPIADDPLSICCPSDGTLSQCGEIRDGRIFQAKGHDYSLLELLGGDAVLSAQFDAGAFATIYLSPRDYHRVHMPFSGTLKQMVHVPGRLFSVNETTTRQVPRLFARNERVISLFETEAGPMAVILVGAIFVASMDTVWAGAVAPGYRGVHRAYYGAVNDSVALDKGAEMGRFNMGSTVVLLFGKDAVEWSESLVASHTVRMGQEIARLKTEKQVDEL